MNPADLTATVDREQSHNQRVQADPNVLLTIPEAAARLRISRSSMYRLFDTGEIRWVRVCASRRVSTAELDRFIAEHTEGTPKSKASARVLPLPEHLAIAFKAAKTLQAADRLALGTGYRPSGYVVANEGGAPLSPGAITSRWEHVLEGAGVRKVRLHDARHTCGTLMHLKGVPIAVVAAWLGHASSAFTQAVYTHSQPEAMKAAAQSFTRVVTNRDNSGYW